MSTNDFVNLIGHHPFLLITFFLAVPLLSRLNGALHGPGNGDQAPWRGVYAVLLYLACIPGMFSCALTAYTLFITRKDLLNVPPLVYFGPIVAMIATLVIIHRQVAFKAIPGIHRLSAFMLIIAVSFAVILAIEKTYIGVLFLGNFFYLLLLALAIFLLLKMGDPPPLPPPRGDGEQERAGDQGVTIRPMEISCVAGVMKASKRTTLIISATCWVQRISLYPIG